MIARQAAPDAEVPVFLKRQIPATIPAMSVFEFLLQTVTDWARDVLAGVVGRHAEEFIEHNFKRKPRRRKGSRAKRVRGAKAIRRFK